MFRKKQVQLLGKSLVDYMLFVCLIMTQANYDNNVNKRANGLTI
ncbi:hypothetical protein B4114_0690 [Geobacillus stearothermophilus]|uniref:Uncharacterized protein n=1 Tax=Geobacillus stearothermophilus TaxID=1422 RepID=A0A150NBB4_GEOSE|nr:hypothetical protein B4114_0690 [Geobacillus stearothermophilus]